MRGLKGLIDTATKSRHDETGIPIGEVRLSPENIQQAGSYQQVKELLEHKCDCLKHAAVTLLEQNKSEIETLLNNK